MEIAESILQKIEDNIRWVFWEKFKIVKDMILKKCRVQDMQKNITSARDLDANKIMDVYNKKHIIRDAI